jgi:hypothetical protein
MSVTEADVMTLQGEQVYLGPKQTAEYSASIARQYAYEAERRADFGTGRGPFGIAAADTAFALTTGTAFGLVSAFTFGGGGYGGVPSLGAPRQLSQQEGFGGQVLRGDAQTNFPPRSGDVYRPPPTGRAVVPYEPPPLTPIGPFSIGIIGAIAAGLAAGIFESDMPGGSLFPNQLGPEPGPYDTRAPSASPVVRTAGPGMEDLGAGPIEPQGPDLNRAPSPVEGPAPYDFGELHDRARKAMEDQLVKDMTTPAPAPAPLPTPRRRGLPGWVWPVVGALGGLSLLRSGKSGTPGLFPVPDRGPIDPITSSSSASSIQPVVLSGGGFGLDSGSDNCNCHKRAGKKRRCLAKAKIGWRSGPKKGKLAGTRCYRFAND